MADENRKRAEERLKPHLDTLSKKFGSNFRDSPMYGQMVDEILKGRSPTNVVLDRTAG